MEKQELRVVIKFFYLKGLTSTAIHAEMCSVLGAAALSLQTVDKWRKEFQRGKDSCEDAPRSGRPSDIVTLDLVTSVEKAVMDDRFVTQRCLAQLFGVSKGSIQTIIHEELQMRKVCTRWVPRLLTVEMRRTRMDCSTETMALIDEDPDRFSSRLVTGDESWIHFYDPLSPREARAWKHRGSPTPKRPKAEKSAGKVMMSVFWDKDGVLLLDFLPRGHTLTGEYYANLMQRLREAIKSKRRGKLSRGVLLLHDNAPVHKSRVAASAIRQCGFEELNHPPYSPDLAPSDFYLFGILKKRFRGQRFDSDEEVKEAVETFFENCDNEFFAKGIHGLRDRFDSCIAAEGHYFE